MARSQCPPRTSLQEIARQLLAYEAAAADRARGSETYRVWEKLRGPLEKLIGANGFRALLARALALARAEVPALLALQIKADGSLQGLNELQAEADPDAIADSEVALVSELLGLLVTFIGSGLTLRLLHDIWPSIVDPSF